MFNAYTSRYSAFEIRNTLKNILAEVTTSTPSTSLPTIPTSTLSPSTAETDVEIDAQTAQSAWQTSLRSKLPSIDNIEEGELTTNLFADHRTEPPAKEREEEEEEEEEEFGPFISSPQPIHPFIHLQESDSLLPSPIPPTPFPKIITPPTTPKLQSPASSTLYTLLSKGLSPHTLPQHDTRTRRIRRFGKSTLRDARARDVEREKKAKKSLRVFEERLTDTERERLKGVLERVEEEKREKGGAVGVVGVVAAGLGWGEEKMGKMV